MEAESLHVLQEIRGILFFIAAVITVGFLYWILSSSSILYAAIRAAVKKDWKEQAIEYFDAGKFDELLSHCQEREKTHQNDPSIYYWQARVHYVNGDMEKASELFSRALKISPDWKEHIEPFLSK